MKLKKMMFLLSFLTIFVGLITLCTESVQAANSTVFKDGDKLKLILDDGNGVNRVFKFDLPFTIKPDTPIRLYSNNIEIPSGDFTIDYANSTITIADSRPTPGKDQKII